VTTTPELPPKKDVMLALLERSSVFIHLDPRREDVRVPAWFKKQPQLVLQVGLNMAVRIPDLDVGDEAVCCTLSFSRSPFFCYMPWTAVFALVAEDGKGMLWPNDIPPEVAAQQADQAQKDQARERMRQVPAPAPDPEKKPEKGPGPAALPGKAAGKKRGTARLRAAKPGSPAVPPPAASKKEAAEISRPAADREGREARRPLPSYLRVVK
jgi:stringent starvation protein B